MTLAARDVHIYASYTYMFAGGRPIFSMRRIRFGVREIKVENKHHGKGLEEA